ncbi:hypothetical protein GUITHDRAFT_160793 [Guillardia theta CCMP2712]|uniref:ABM domain-containing protein n=1 Tax=Guillardia theta (strain CCMP2712) TaxID=905079 RepID=L1K101_GUITC|nr:hypothetical protein GUITHDRAFT_160793 [Guillardia theta CCMP2712]EKX54053.1 hypothetical protein GUITHDRAFT_160793 [Guillardia theta CCMP2712]|eukprot:XP_005841033.1 hypothetical protein GUITHDRAFT_160793 [Guillardia theta CCMP2712]
MESVPELKPGCKGFCVLFRVPNAATDKVDKFFDGHQAFMRKTHPTSGTEEPVVISYHVMRSPELVNNLDPSQGTTGFTMYSMVEAYRSMEGCAKHMELGQKTGDLFKELVEMISAYCKVALMFGGVIGTMEVAIQNINSSITKGTMGFHGYFRATNDEEETFLDKFIVEHTNFMNETHHITGDTEPRLLYFAWSKTEELVNPVNPEEGKTGSKVYSLVEIYRGDAGCAAHMEAGQNSAIWSDFVKALSYSPGGIFGGTVVWTI